MLTTSLCCFINHLIHVYKMSATSLHLTNLMFQLCFSVVMCCNNTKLLWSHCDYQGVCTSHVCDRDSLFELLWAQGVSRLLRSSLQLATVIQLRFNRVKSWSLSNIVYMRQYENNLLRLAAAYLLHFQYEHL